MRDRAWETVHDHYQDGARSHTLLNGVDACFDCTESVALLGASGCGKSILLNMIAGIEPVTGHLLRQ